MTFRSRAWIDGDDEVAMSHRVALRLDDVDRGKPVVGIADTASALNPCNIGFTRLIPEIERGIRDAGGVPARFPVMSLGEDLMKPSAMLYRNLVAMELEETVRANPLDGVVYLANCDKSVPASIMAAVTTDLPSLLLLGGARSAPLFNGKPLGTGTDLWRALDERRAGRMDDQQWLGLERTLSCTGPGACNTMGTASTMAILTEVLGMSLPGTAGLAAVGDELMVAAYQTGVAVTQAVLADERPASRLTQVSLDNAIRTLAAVAGSTNAVIHLAAIAGRLGLDAGLERMDALWHDIDLLADVEPSGTGLIHDFRRDGGVPALVAALGDQFDTSARSGDGRAWAVAAASAPQPTGVIHSRTDPVASGPTLAAVFGSLAPTGAVIKTAAATSSLLSHTGRALVFDDYADMRERLDDESLVVTAEDVIVVRTCGPVGVPGMPEWGMAPLPKRLVEQGVTDMVRISDGRMSGTSFGTVVLHVSPESAVGGPLALVEDGDLIELDVVTRRLSLLVDESELERRRAEWRPSPPRHLRGWPKLYAEHVQQAPDGCDLDFLAAPSPETRRFIEPVVGRS
ncbi:dihydroxy-acid dehydratase [Subtercola endophyticus]|uniref:dihydroxy-acid dehydratase n=1 Tax=Subtercola endophyticus TaxID=2895559 RepID=UPI001E4235CA|nr:dihydroxy-acid dehydratase [Subtercola endophyticus]UFS58557.1 dihydroxy-acid dehydratase [Subtercola endophyticus]